MSDTFVLLLFFSAIAFVITAIFPTSPTKSYQKSLAELKPPQPEAETQLEVDEQPTKPMGAGRLLYVTPVGAQKIPLALRHSDGPRSYADMLDVIWQHGGVVGWFEQAVQEQLDELGCEVVVVGENGRFPYDQFSLQLDLLNVVRSPQLGKVVFKARLRIGNQDLLLRTYTAVAKTREILALGAFIGDQVVGRTHLGPSNRRNNQLVSEALENAMRDLRQDLGRILPYLNNTSSSSGADAHG